MGYCCQQPSLKPSGDLRSTVDHIENRALEMAASKNVTSLCAFEQILVVQV